MEFESLYRVYSNYLKNKYGQKVYKLPVNIPCTCPNRDGSKGTGGCIFCGASGSGNELHDVSLSVTEQLEKNRDLIEKRYNAHRFIAYYQSFSNTYLNFNDFKQYITEGAKFPGVVEIAISTRPDCVEDKHIEFLKNLKESLGVEVTIELGLQSANENTLTILRRGHTVADYLDAAVRIKKAGLNLCTHLISDLPWDSKDDVIKTGRLISKAGTDFLKVHSLYVEKGTELERLYKKGLKLLSADSFIDRTISLLENIRDDIVVERLIGRVPEADCVSANWHQSWWRIRDELVDEMQRRKTYQGREYERTIR